MKLIYFVFLFVFFFSGVSSSVCCCNCFSFSIISSSPSLFADGKHSDTTCSFPFALLKALHKTAKSDTSTKAKTGKFGNWKYVCASTFSLTSHTHTHTHITQDACVFHVSPESHFVFCLLLLTNAERSK